MVQQWIEQASRGAARIRALLRSKGLDRTVTPILITWLHGAARLPRAPSTGWPIQIVDGWRDDNWIREIEAGAQGSEPDAAAFDELMRFIAVRDEDGESRK